MRFIVMIAHSDCVDYNEYGITDCECALKNTVLRVFDRFVEDLEDDTSKTREKLSSCCCDAILIRSFGCLKYAVDCLTSTD